MNIVDSIVLYLLGIFSSFLSLILKPIDLLLSTIVPTYSDLSTNFITLFSYFRNTFLFILNWIHFPPELISLIIAYIT